MTAGDVKLVEIQPRAFNCNNFDGVDDYIEIAHNDAQLGANLTNGFTISAWVNARTLGESSLGNILNKSTGTNAANGFYLQISDTNNLVFRINGGSAKFSANNAIVLKTWQHVLVTVTSAQLCSTYINGVINGTPNQDLVQQISTITTTNAMRIGNRSTATDRTVDGGIKSIKMWNRVLTAAEIAVDAAGGNTTSGQIHNFKLGGDYTDRGSVGVTATTSGSAPMIIEDNIAVAVKALRVTANDKTRMCASPGGKMTILNVEGAP